MPFLVNVFKEANVDKLKHLMEKCREARTKEKQKKKKHRKSIKSLQRFKIDTLKQTEIDR